MHRRNLLRKIGAASAIAIGGAGVAGAGGGTGAAATDVAGIRWQFDGGRVEELDVAEFRQRRDTPSTAELGGDPADVLDCCLCQDYPIDCVLCYNPPCLDDPFAR